MSNSPEDGDYYQGKCPTCKKETNNFSEDEEGKYPNDCDDCAKEAV